MEFVLQISYEMSHQVSKSISEHVGNVASISEAALVFSVFNYFKVW